MSTSEALLNLQDIDLQIIRIDAQLAAMPQMEKISVIDRALKKVNSQLTEIIIQRKDLEFELDDNENAHEETVRRTDEVMAEASERAANFRQTRDLEAHLTALAKRKEKLEFANLGLTERLDKAGKAEENARALVERLEAEKRAQQDSYEQSTSNLQAQRRLLVGNREALRSELPDDLLARYDQAVKRFDGLAVESVEVTEEDVDAPSICRVRLQSSLASEVRRGGDIIDCPYCRRILVIKRHMHS